MNTLRIAALALLALSGAPQDPVAPRAHPDQIVRGIDQLHHVVGNWKTKTEFLNDDGSVARSVVGTYHFEWVVPDRVVAGESEIPELDRKSGILFYVNVDKEVIEMSAVSGDGELWVMTGPIGGETRTTAPRTNPDGTTLQLRFTRFAVEADGFESKMEFSTDAGKTWKPGNHQVFARAD